MHNLLCLGTCMWFFVLLVMIFILLRIYSIFPLLMIQQLQGVIKSSEPHTSTCQLWRSVMKHVTIPSQVDFTRVGRYEDISLFAAFAIRLYQGTFPLKSLWLYLWVYWTIVDNSVNQWTRLLYDVIRFLLNFFVLMWFSAKICEFGLAKNIGYFKPHKSLLAFESSKTSK